MIVIMFKTFLILLGVITTCLATPLNEENLKAQFLGFEMPSQEEVDLINAKEPVENGPVFQGIQGYVRRSRRLASLNREEDGKSFEYDPATEEPEPMPHFNITDSGDRYVNPDGYGKYVWQTYLRMYRNAAFTSWGACTGSAICPRIVLTAGHCIAQESVDWTYVYSSPSSFCPPNVTPVRANYFYWYWSLDRPYPASSINSHDLGFIRLSSNINGWYYNILPGVPAPPYSFSIGVGYGGTGTQKPAQESCTSTYSYFGRSGCSFANNGQWICVTAIRPNGGFCRGDSGGPLTYSDVPVGVGSTFYGPIPPDGQPLSCFDQWYTIYASISYYRYTIRDVVAYLGGCN